MPTSTTQSSQPEYHLPHIRFHTNAVAFCDLINDVVIDAQQSNTQCPVSPLTIGIGKRIISTTDPTFLIESFIRRSAAHWTAIYNKDVEFFRGQGLNIFSGIPENQIKAFSQLFDIKDNEGNALIDDGTLEQFWSFFHSFVKIAVCHIHLQRKPDPITKKYTQTYFSEISIRKEVETWKIKELK
jgi:hypothetical protein